MTEEQFTKYLKQSKELLKAFDENKISEEDTKVKVIHPLLYLLGYDESSTMREVKEGLSKKESDIQIDVKTKIFYTENSQIVIETKNLNVKLGREESRKIVGDYMVDKKPVWGILTNGNEYKLFGKPFNSYDDTIEIYKVNLDVRDVDTNDKELINKLYNEINIFSRELLIESIYGRALKALSSFLKHQKEKFTGKNLEHDLRTYKDEIKCFITFMMTMHPKVQFEEINGYYIKEFAEYRCMLKKRKGCINKPYRLQVILNLVNSFLNFCYNEKIIRYLPRTNEIEIKKLANDVFENVRGNVNYNKKHSIALKKYELITILKKMRSSIDSISNMDSIEEQYILYRNYLIFIMGLYTACKKDELRNLSWEDIDFNKRIISMPKMKIELNSNIINELKVYKGIYKKYYKIANCNLKKKFLFLKSIKYYVKKGVNQIAPTDLGYIIERTLKKCEINEKRRKLITVESLAITAIAIAIEEGNIFFISKIPSRRISMTDLKKVYLDYSDASDEELCLHKYMYNHPLNKFLI